LGLTGLDWAWLDWAWLGWLGLGLKKFPGDFLCAFFELPREFSGLGLAGRE